MMENCFKVKYFSGFYVFLVHSCIIDLLNKEKQERGEWGKVSETGKKRTTQGKMHVNM